MKTKPAISVVMPVYNGENYLRISVDSILKQTFPSFELIIINDGSSDKTREIVKSYRDPRIVYLENTTNLGLSKSFNKGIKASQGDFIARMDHDDISLSDRFQKEMQFLKHHPEIGLVGSGVWLIDKNGNRLKAFGRPENHLNIKWASLFSSPMYHPTIMARKNVLKNNLFNEKLHNSEDYELWSRLLFTTNTGFANIQEPLLLYRVYPESFTQTLHEEKREASAQNSINNISRYISLTEAERNAIILLRQNKLSSIVDLVRIWFLYLKAAKSFCVKEQVKGLEVVEIYWKLFHLALFLIKYWVRFNY